MNKKFDIIKIVFLISVLIVSWFNIQIVHANSLTTVSDVLTSLTKLAEANHTFTFTTPTGVDAGEYITITFPSDFTPDVGIGFADIDMTDDDSDLTLAAMATGTTWGAAFSEVGNRVLTLTSDTGAIGAGSTVTVEIGTNATIPAVGTKQIANASVAASYTIEIDGDFGDSGSITTAILDSGEITISAITDPILSFSITNTALGFGHFASTTARYATSDNNGSVAEPGADEPTKLEGGTNSASGLVITVSDQGNGTNAGLWSPAPISELISAAASSVITDNSKKYGVYAKNASDLTIDEGFDHDSNGDLAISRSAQTLASTSGPESSASLDLVFKAAVNGSTKAGVYDDTITVICTGNY